MQIRKKTAIVALITFALMMTLVLSSFTAVSFAAEDVNGNRIQFPNSSESGISGGAWPNTGGVSLSYNASSAGFNPYSTLPKTPHVLWTHEVMAGGMVGGYNPQNGYYENSAVTYAGNGAVVVAGRVYYAKQTFDGQSMDMYCLDEETGELLWKSDKPIPTTSTNIQVFQKSYKTSNTGQGNTVLVLSGAHVYFIDGDSGHYWKDLVFPASALNIAAGWNDTEGKATISYGNTANQWYMYGGVKINPRLSYAYCYQFTNYDGGLITPILIWNTTFAGEVRYSMYTYRNVLVSPDYGTFVLRAFDRYTGQVIWTIPFLQYNTPSLGYEKVFCGGEDNYMYAFDIQTGAQLWRSETPLNSFFNQHCHYIGNGLVIGNGYDGTVNAWDAETGKLVWRHYNGDCPTEPFKSWYGTWVYNQQPLGGTNAVVTVTGDHMGTNPAVPGERMTVFDVLTGEVWYEYPLFASQHNSGHSVADGMIFAHDAYTGQLFAFGKGPSAVTVSVSQSQIAKGGYTWITGTVTDQSAGQVGTPCVSSADMAAWMKYLHSSYPAVQDKKGVTLTLYAQSSDGTTITIGDVTTNGDTGAFSTQWVPPTESMYTITGVFLGDDSYWTSNGSTTLAVGPQQAAASASSSSSTTAAISIASLAAVVLGAIAIKKPFKKTKEETLR